MLFTFIHFKLRIAWAGHKFKYVCVCLKTNVSSDIKSHIILHHQPITLVFSLTEYINYYCQYCNKKHVIIQRLDSIGLDFRISRQGSRCVSAVPWYTVLVCKVYIFSGDHYWLTCCRSMSCRSTSCRFGPFKPRGVVTEILITYTHLVLSRWRLYVSIVHRRQCQVLSCAPFHVISVFVTFTQCSWYTWNQPAYFT